MGLLTSVRLTLVRIGHCTDGKCRKREPCSRCLLSNEEKGWEERKKDPKRTPRSSALSYSRVRICYKLGALQEPCNYHHPAPSPELQAYWIIHFTGLQDKFRFQFPSSLASALSCRQRGGAKVQLPAQRLNQEREKRKQR